MGNLSKLFRALFAGSIVWALGHGQASSTQIQFGSNYYEFVLADSISWADANAAASARTYLGLNGHLATVTSAAENDFLANSLADFSAYNNLLAIAWLGAQIDASGVGSWVVGSEAGQQFSIKTFPPELAFPPSSGYPQIQIGKT